MKWTGTWPRQPLQRSERSTCRHWVLWRRCTRCASARHVSQVPHATGSYAHREMHERWFDISVRCDISCVFEDFLFSALEFYFNARRSRQGMTTTRRAVFYRLARGPDIIPCTSDPSPPQRMTYRGRAISVDGCDASEKSPRQGRG